MMVSPGSYAIPAKRKQPSLSVINLPVSRASGYSAPLCSAKNNSPYGEGTSVGSGGEAVVGPPVSSLAVVADGGMASVAVVPGVVREDVPSHPANATAAASAAIAGMERFTHVFYGVE